MENVGIFYGHWEYFTAIWYILWPFRIVVVTRYFFPVLVYCVKTNLATLVGKGICYHKNVERETFCGTRNFFCTKLVKN
jgi:hypothetical protein